MATTVVSSKNIRPARPDEVEFLTELALRSKAHWGYDEAFNFEVEDILSYQLEM